jgi:lipopolysaccharide transport system ATP-binding protein
MNDIAIQVENLSKCYRLGIRKNGYRTLRESIMGALSHPLLKKQRAKSIEQRVNETKLFALRSPLSADHIWALKDISFDVNQGEVVGIIGPNGAGKSTLLKILSRITEPTKGRAEIHGRLGALLEVGTGFHSELTGRENIFLSGAILGMGKAEIRHKFDEIVAFAEVDKFIDTPVKHYSTGMMVRLAFAVAAHLEPEILLVDEVLAVGDMAFQKKCLGRMEETTKGGRTVLFVSHNLGAVRQLCSRVIWLDRGIIMAQGDAEKVIARYQEEFSRGFIISNMESEALRVESVVLRDREGEAKTSFRPGEDLAVEINFYAKQRIPRPFFWINVVGPYGSLFGANMLFDGHCPDFIEGKGKVGCVLRNIPLVPQTYSIRMGARRENGVTFLVRTADVATFAVEGSAKSLGWNEKRADILMNGSAPVFVPYEWQLPDGRVFKVNPDWGLQHE